MKTFLDCWSARNYWLLSSSVKKLVKSRRYFEPFLGSGSLFFALKPKKATLSDSNCELINCFLQVRDHCKYVIKILKGLSANKDTILKIINTLYVKADPIQRASYFIYLNNLRLIDENEEFNIQKISLGSDTLIFEKEHLMSANKLLKHAEILCCDFEESLKEAKGED